MMLNYRWIRIALVAFAFGCVHMSHAQQSAVVLATGPGGDKVFLRIDAALLRGDLDTLYTTTAGLQDQIDTLSWEDVLTNGTTPGVDVDFFGYSALGLGSVTTTGMFTGDSLFLNKDAVISGRLNVNDVVSFTDSLLVSGTVVLGDSIRVVGAASFGSRLHVTGVTAFGDSIHVVGNVDLDALFHVDGAATFGSTITVSGETTLNDTLRVQSAALVRDSLDVQGQAFFNDEVHLNDSLVVLGNGSIAGSLDVLGESNFTGDAYFGDSLVVADVADFLARVQMYDTLRVAGSTLLSDSLYVGGNAYFDQLLKAQALRADSSLTLSGTASNYHSAAIGANSTASAVGASSIGNSANASGIQSVAIGTLATASNVNAVAVGYQASASGVQAVAVGQGATAGGSNANVALGVTSSVTEGWGNTAIGGGTINGSGGSPTRNITLGTATISSTGAYNVAQGYSSTISGSSTTGSMTFGPSSSVSTGYRNMAFGANSSITGGNSNYAFGDGSSVTNGWNSAAFGNNSKVQSNAANAYAFGAHSSVGAFNTANFAYASPARFSNLALFGSYADTTAMAPGANSHNNWIPTDPLFVVANGASDGARSNTLTILKNGKATFSDSLVVEGIANFTSEVSFTDSLHGAAADFSGVLTADSLVATKVINGQIRDLANHNTDDLVETSTNRYYTPARELALQAQIDSLETQMSELLDLLFNPPTVTTTAASAILATTASLNGTYTDGGASPSDAGFIISTSSVFADSTIHVVTPGGGSLLKALTGLTKGTTYYYKAYIETIMGSATGSVQQFTTIGDVVLAATPPASVTGQTTTGLSSSITSAGGGTVTATGFKYSTNANLSGASTIAGSATSGTFTANLSGLTRETLYYFSPFATNEAGTVYGDTLSFTTYDMCNDQTTLAYNGYTYDIVAIGGQCWFAENLQTTLQNDGNPVFNMFNDGYYPPNGNGADVASYGYHYGYYSQTNLCPTGWAIPSSTDFNTLTAAVPNSSDLKAGATSPGWNGTNASGFNALPAGKALHSGAGGGNIPVTSGFGSEAHFWTSGQEITFRINSSGTGFDNYGSLPNPFPMVSVRCIKQ